MAYFESKQTGTGGRTLSTGMERRVDPVVSRPFVGRLGGNQAFTASKDDPDYDEILKNTPDASGHFTCAEAFDFSLFLDFDLWQQALIEGWATCMFVFITGSIGYGIAAKTP
jgi:hypothetical protein